MMTFGQNISNVLGSIRGGMNQFRTNLGGFLQNLGNRRQASQNSQGPTAMIKVSPPEETKPLQLDVTKPEEFWAAGFDPAKWQHGTPTGVEAAGRTYYAVQPGEGGIQFRNPLESAKFPVYSTKGQGIAATSLEKLRADLLASGSLGLGGPWQVNRVFDEILGGQRVGIGPEGQLVSVTPQNLSKLRGWAGGASLDFAPYEEEWNREAGYWYGEPTEPAEGILLMSNQNTWDEWSRLPGFTSETAKWLSSIGVTPGADSTSPWSATGDYDLGVENTELNSLLDLLASYMQTTPLGTSAAVDPNLIGQILAATGRGGQVWSPSTETEEYLANIQPMVSLPMGY